MIATPTKFLRVPRRHPAARARAAGCVLLAAFAFLAVNAPAQVIKTVFEDDFETPGIDPARYVADAPFFEGGQGDIAGTIANGVLEFAGHTIQQWWSGGTLRVVPVFNASEAQTVEVTVDRVAENGVGTASRSALWIMSGTNSQTHTLPACFRSTSTSCMRTGSPSAFATSAIRSALARSMSG